jgi:hypothetical protein
MIVAVGLAAACNSGKDSPGKGNGNGGKKDEAKPSSTSGNSKAKTVAEALALHGFYLEEQGADIGVETDDSQVGGQGQATTGAGQAQQQPVADQAMSDDVARILEENQAQQQQATAQGTTDGETQQQATAQGTDGGTGGADGEVNVDVTQQQQGTGQAQQQQMATGQVMQQQQGTGQAQLPQQQPIGQGPIAQCQECLPPDIFGKPMVSRFEVTVLSRDNDPVVNAQLKIQKEQFRGKRGYTPMDSFAITLKRTNKAILWVAAGHHYTLAASARGYELLLKDLKINSKASVDVSFPIVMDKMGEGGQYVDFQPDQYNTSYWKQPPQPPQQQQGPGTWPWCLQATDPSQGQAIAQGQGQLKDAPPVKVLGLMLAAQNQMQQQAGGQLMNMMQQVQDPAMEEAFQQCQKFQDSGYQVQMIDCSNPDNMKVKWWKSDKDYVMQRIPQQPLQQAFPQGPIQQMQPQLQAPTQQQAPVAQQQQATATQQQAPVAQQQQQAAPTQQQSQAGHLLACDVNPDWVDLYGELSAVGMKDVITQMKAVYKAGFEFDNCSVSGKQVTINFKASSSQQGQAQTQKTKSLSLEGAPLDDYFL